MRHDRMTVRLACWDLFDSQRWTQQADFGTVHTRFRNNWESRQINLGLTWNFGKSGRERRERVIGAEKKTLHQKQRQPIGTVFWHIFTAKARRREEISEPFAASRLAVKMDK